MVGIGGKVGCGKLDGNGGFTDNPGGPIWKKLSSPNPQPGTKN
jgi:hypothetical protein